MAVLPGDRESRWVEWVELLASLEWAEAIAPLPAPGVPVGPACARLVIELKSLKKKGGQGAAVEPLLSAGEQWLLRFSSWRRKAVRDAPGGLSVSEQIEFSNIPADRYPDILICGRLIDGLAREENDEDDLELLSGWFIGFLSRASAHARKRGLQNDSEDCALSFITDPWLRRLLFTYQPHQRSLDGFLFHQFTRFYVTAWQRKHWRAAKREVLIESIPEPSAQGESIEARMIGRESRARARERLLMARNAPGVKPEHWNLLWQHDVVGKTFKEIAALRGVSPGSLNEKASAARKRIKRFLGGLGAGI